VHKQLDRGSMPKRYADVVSLLNLDKEGSDDAGYRISIASGGEPSYLYVKRRGGQYRIWDPGKNYGEFGRVALERLKSQDIAGAKQILQWCSEGLKAPTGTDLFGGIPFVKIWISINHDDPQEL